MSAPKEMNAKCTIDFPLYHGTSTLFLEGILEHGLGGRNPLKDAKVFEFTKALWPLVERFLAKEDDYMSKVATFKKMVHQQSDAMNFQHGDTYLSPVQFTAIRYAANKKYGSELLTYALFFLEVLLIKKTPGLVDELYQRFPEIFHMLDISPAPILIEVNHVEVEALDSEHGGEATAVIQKIRNTRTSDSKFFDDTCAQDNFRLCKSVSTNRLKISLLNVTNWHPLNPSFKLYRLDVPVS